MVYDNSCQLNIHLPGDIQDILFRICISEIHKDV